MLLLNTFYFIFILIKMTAHISSFLIFVKPTNSADWHVRITLGTEQWKNLHKFPENKVGSLKIIKLLVFKEN